MRRCIHRSSRRQRDGRLSVRNICYDLGDNYGPDTAVRDSSVPNGLSFRVIRVREMNTLVGRAGSAATLPTRGGRRNSAINRSGGALGAAPAINYK